MSINRALPLSGALFAALASIYGSCTHDEFFSSLSAALATGLLLVGLIYKEEAK